MAVPRCDPWRALTHWPIAVPRFNRNWATCYRPLCYLAAHYTKLVTLQRKVYAVGVEPYFMLRHRVVFDYSGFRPSSVRTRANHPQFFRSLRDDTVAITRTVSCFPFGPLPVSG